MKQWKVKIFCQTNMHAIQFMGPSIKTLNKTFPIFNSHDEGFPNKNLDIYLINDYNIIYITVYTVYPFVPSSESVLNWH